jgi:hypothetical protein
VRTIPLLIAVLSLAACSSTLKPSTPNPSTGYFATESKISKGGVVTEAPFDSKYLGILYVKTDVKSDKLNDFYVTTFKNMAKFGKVYDRSNLETLVIQQGLADKVPNISDLIGLKHLSDVIGPVLVVEPQAQFEGGYRFSASLRAVDAQTGQEVLLLKNRAFNWAGLDQPLFYPLFNGFLDWTNGRPITTE